MNIYFDCEFTGLNKKTTLISLGCISEDGRTFYAEFSDYDRYQINDWIIENVINKLRLCTIRTEHGTPSSTMFKIDGINGFSTESYGTLADVRIDFLNWLYQFETVQFIADCCHYDFVLLIDLISTHALHLPEFISPVCHELNNDISNYLNINPKEAFDISRESLVDTESIKIEKHNALYDAIICKKIYNKIRGGSNWRMIH